jgi:glutamine amidotransferase
VESEITSDFEKIIRAEKVIFPGVGEASSTMKFLEVHKLNSLITNLKQPVLGICLGMQLLCNFSEEGNTECLNILPNKVLKFVGDQKIPHIGWNRIFDLKGELFKNIEAGSYVYFVHSYFANLNVNTSATCNYIYNFSAALQKDNFFAVQFHPEKSGKIGEQILKNFIAF